MTTEAALKAWATRRRNGWVHPNAVNPKDNTWQAAQAREDKPAPKKGVQKKASAKQIARAAELSRRAKKAVQTRMANAQAAKRAKAKKKARG